jgi:hypothetical protein
VFAEELSSLEDLQETLDSVRTVQARG